MLLRSIRPKRATATPVFRTGPRISPAPSIQRHLDLVAAPDEAPYRRAAGCGGSDRPLHPVGGREVEGDPLAADRPLSRANVTDGVRSGQGRLPRRIETSPPRPRPSGSVRSGFGGWSRWPPTTRPPARRPAGGFARAPIAAARTDTHHRRVAGQAFSVPCGRWYNRLWRGLSMSLERLVRKSKADDGGSRSRSRWTNVLAPDGRRRRLAAPLGSISSDG